MIWFTWLQVTLFDIRFARDSVFERICKVVELGTMIGFASAGSRFTTRIRDDNVWAFKALTVLLAVSRLMLAVQYSINLNFMHRKMKAAVKGMLVIISVLLASSAIFTGVSSVISFHYNGLITPSYTLLLATDIAVETMSGLCGLPYLQSR